MSPNDQMAECLDYIRRKLFLTEDVSRVVNQDDNLEFWIFFRFPSFLENKVGDLEALALKSSQIQILTFEDVRELNGKQDLRTHLVKTNLIIPDRERVHRPYRTKLQEVACIVDFVNELEEMADDKNKCRVLIFDVEKFELIFSKYLHRHLHDKGLDTLTMALESHYKNKNNLLIRCLPRYSRDIRTPFLIPFLKDDLPVPEIRNPEELDEKPEKKEVRQLLLEMLYWKNYRTIELLPQLRSKNVFEVTATLRDGSGQSSDIVKFDSIGKIEREKENCDIYTRNGLTVYLPYIKGVANLEPDYYGAIRYCFDTKHECRVKLRDKLPDYVEKEKDDKDKFAEIQNISDAILETLTAIYEPSGPQRKDLALGVFFEGRPFSPNSEVVSGPLPASLKVIISPDNSDKDHYLEREEYSTYDDSEVNIEDDSVVVNRVKVTEINGEKSRATIQVSSTAQEPLYPKINLIYEKEEWEVDLISRKILEGSVIRAKGELPRKNGTRIGTRMEFLRNQVRKISAGTIIELFRNLLEHFECRDLIPLVDDPLDHLDKFLELRPAIRSVIGNPDALPGMLYASIHGDMNVDNLVIYPTTNNPPQFSAKLIDLEKAGCGPIAFDLAKFEIELRNQMLADSIALRVEEEKEQMKNISNIVKFELKLLLNLLDRKPASNQIDMNGIPFRNGFKLVDSMWRAKILFQSDRRFTCNGKHIEPLEYMCCVFLYSLSTLKFDFEENTWPHIWAYSAAVASLIYLRRAEEMGGFQPGAGGKAE